MAAPVPTLLLPGLDGTGILFARFAAALGEGLMPQAIGYPPDTPLGYHELMPLVERARPRGLKFVLVGESFSGPLALKLAAKRPPGLLAVVLVGSFARSPVSPLLAPLVGARLMKMASSEFLIRRYLTGNDGPPELVEDVQRCLRTVGTDVLARRVKDVLSVDAREEVRTCPVPILYLQGAHDKLVPRTVADELRALNPALKAESLDAPHLMLQRAPDAAAAALRRFLEPLH